MIFYSIFSELLVNHIEEKYKIRTGNYVCEDTFNGTILPFLFT
jgi:hypothetical protein